MLSVLILSGFILSVLILCIAIKPNKLNVIIVFTLRVAMMNAVILSVV
jgi:hypothetical protein